MPSIEDKKNQAMAAVGALAFLIFLPALGGEFTNWDDPGYVTGNLRIQTLGISGWLRIWSPADALGGRFIEYFPLRDSVYALCWWLAPGKTGLFHGVQIALHAGASMLAFRWLLALKLKVPGALAGALLFALHPVHVESVAWISALKDPLFFCFFAAAMLAFLKREERSSALFLSLIFLVLGFLSKSFVIAFVPVAFFTEVFLKGTSARKALRALLPHLVVTLAFLVLFLLIGQANSVIQKPHGGTRLNAMLLGAWCFWQYVGLLLLPLFQSTFYVLEPIAHPLEWRAMVAVLALVGSGAALFLGKSAHQGRIRFVALCLFFSLLPVLHVIQVSTYMADRYLYLASFFLCVGVGWLVDSAWKEDSRRLFLGLVAVALLLSSVKTVVRIGVWQSSTALWADARDQPLGLEISIVLFQSAASALARGDKAEGERWLQEVLALSEKKKINPARVRGAHRILGWLSLEKGDLNAAQSQVRALEEMIGESGDLAKNPALLHLRARVRKESGDLPGALMLYRELEKTGRMNPGQKKELEEIEEVLGRSREAPNGP
jgi:hypothetical protein